MENPQPLKACRVRLFAVEDPTQVLKEVPTDYRGRFGFEAADLGGRDVGQLGLEVVAWNHGRIRVCYESSHTPWSFRVAAQDVGEGPPDVLDVLGPRMEIEVPEVFRRDVRVYNGDARALTRGTELHSGKRAFFAFCLLLQMRSFYWQGGSKDRVYPRAAGATVIYPASYSYYRPRYQVIYLDGHHDPNGDGGNKLSELPDRRFDFSSSWLAHEFGHHLYAAAMPNAHVEDGTHRWERNEQPPTGSGDSNYTRFIRGLHLDFSEGYATFVGQAFLATTLYEQGTPSSGERGAHDMETPACSSGFGDGATAGYLWDLIDRGAEAGDDLSLSFAQVHAELARFGGVIGDGYLSLPRFHEHLLQSDLPVTQAQLERNLVRNQLKPIYDAWKPIWEAGEVP
jgi:hypothetical protein